jgi:hypothetical protein
MKRSYAITRMAVLAKVSPTEAEYLFEERVGIKQDSGISEGAAMRQAYEEISGEVLA